MDNPLDLLTNVDLPEQPPFFSLPTLTLGYFLSGRLSELGCLKQRLSAPPGFFFFNSIPRTGTTTPGLYISAQIYIAQSRSTASYGAARCGAVPCLALLCCAVSCCAVLSFEHTAVPSMKRSTRYQEPVLRVAYSYFYFFFS